jgi:phospholipid transport system substrate-binding protein
MSSCLRIYEARATTEHGRAALCAKVYGFCLNAARTTSRTRGPTSFWIERTPFFCRPFGIAGSNSLLGGTGQHITNLFAAEWAAGGSGRGDRAACPGVGNQTGNGQPEPGVNHDWQRSRPYWVGRSHLLSTDQGKGPAMNKKTHSPMADFSDRLPCNRRGVPNPRPHRDAAIPGLGWSWVRVAKCFAFALVVITGISTASSDAAVEDTPIAFIRALGAQALAVIHRRDLPPPSKLSYFDQLVRQDFDLVGISRFVLGPYWRMASPAQRQEFANLFAQRMIDMYGRRLMESGDGDFAVTGSRTIAGGVIVTSQIVRRQGAPIAVDWRLEISDGLYKIEDVAIAGVSMSLTQRSEVAQSLARQGGQLQTLLATMRQRG